MSVLVGRYVNKIDRKGRVSVPKAFRDAIQSRGGPFAGIYAYHLFKEPAVEACDEAYMTRVAHSLDDLAMHSQDQDDLAAMFLENGHQLPFDPEGRIVLPEVLIAHAGIEADALFVGRGFRFQIWNPQRYEETRAPVFARLKTETPALQLRPAASEAR